MFRFLKSKTFWAGVAAAIGLVTGAQEPTSADTLIGAGALVLGGAGLSDKFDRIKDVLSPPKP